MMMMMMRKENYRVTWSHQVSVLLRNPINEILREKSTAVVIAVERNNICQTLKLRACFVMVVSNNLNGKSWATPANSSQTTNNNLK